MDSPVSAPLGSQSVSTQAEILLPYEIRLMVFKNCDLDSIKSLRLVSKRWASVGLDVLLLPNFIISPAKCDIQRLLNISQHPQLSLIAAKTIKTLKFINNDWDLIQFRNIFSNRVESTSTFIPNSFVPTEYEQLALDELDSYEANVASVEADSSLDRLVLAFKAVPNYQTITIPSTCIFKHRLLKKTWNEYAPSLCLSSKPPQILNILNAINLSNLRPKSLSIKELDSSFAFHLPSDFPDIARSALRDLENLELHIEDMSDYINTEPPSEVHKMSTSFLTTPHLTSLSLSIQPPASIPWPITLLPPSSSFQHLTSLHLSNAEINAEDFLTYLSVLSPTLTHTQFYGLKITSGEMQWKQFLQELRGSLKGLKRFLLAGSVWVVDADGEQRDMWHLYPHCDREWRGYDKMVGGKAWGLERFVLGGGEWPMVDEDDSTLV